MTRTSSEAAASFAISASGRARYQQLLREQLVDIQKAVEAGDMGRVREQAHKIRGSAALFGLADLGEACHALETAALQAVENVPQAWAVVKSIHDTHLCQP